MTKAVPAREPLFSYQAVQWGGFFHARTGEQMFRTEQEGGHMADEQTTSTTPAAVEGAATEQTQPDALAELQAKYDALLKDSRKWEERSKANADKAKAYDELADKAAASAANLSEAERELAETKKKLAVATVAAGAGVPADLLKGETVEELQASADALKAFAASQAPGYPTDKGAGATPQPVTAKQLESIENPLERVQAMARHANLYK